MTEKIKPIPIRIDIRPEGEFYNAYIVQGDDKDRTLLASINFAVVQQADLYDRWKSFLIDAVWHGVRERGGL